MNLVTILLVLFLVLFVVVKIAERTSKPMSHERQAKLSRIILILVGVLLITRLIKELL
ncbi:hypothetical protein CI610_01472 [invertebrate metagenome]|uniref:Uncharacterized protein n=1 Tax=invertebrate metagenome TaxID=1711999 RepID=A0A2H9T8P6_9ZZZZ